MGDVFRRTTCRLCGGGKVELAFALAPTPPANAFVDADKLGVQQKTYPLDVFFCRDCTHVQLLDVVDRRILFENYVYVSGTSPTFVKHFKDYAEAVWTYAAAKPGALVLDVGSNDGTLLRPFKDLGAEVLGVDPARGIAEEATRNGLPTIADFFSVDLAKRIAAEKGSASIVTANNVFAHIDDLGAVTDGIRAVLAHDGLFVFEVSYLLDVIEKTLFDTIYHEHLAYHAVRPLLQFLERHGLELIEAQRVSSHGGSLRGIAQRKGGPRKRGASVDQALALEAARGLERIETYKAFARRINALGGALKAELAAIKAQGKHVMGFGAPAKATTLMYQFAIGKDDIAAIVDDSPLKQGKFSPGLHIPVVPASAITERKPDYLFILAWNFAESIIAKNQEFKMRGGRFIVPVPELKVI